MNIIWECESYGKTIEDAIKEFCSTYWEKPQKPIKQKFTGAGQLGMGAEFQVRGRNSIYLCTFVDNIPGIYRIKRLNEND